MRLEGSQPYTLQYVPAHRKQSSSCVSLQIVRVYLRLEAPDNMCHILTLPLGEGNTASLTMQHALRTFPALLWLVLQM